MSLGRYRLESIYLLKFKFSTMKEFMMLFRHVPNPAYQPSPEDIQNSLKHWQSWIGDIAAQGKFIGTNELESEGQTIGGDGLISDGPYAEVKEIIGGYMHVKAENLAEAVEMAKGCPIISFGGTIEIRSIAQRHYE